MNEWIDNGYCNVPVNHNQKIQFNGPNAWESFHFSLLKLVCSTFPFASSNFLSDSVVFTLSNFDSIVRYVDNQSLTSPNQNRMFQVVVTIFGHSIL